MYNEFTWKNGEKIACDYMKKHGYKICFTNYKVAGVEIDIVASLSVRAQAKAIKHNLKQSLKSEKNRKKRLILTKNYVNFKKSLKNLLIITEVKARSFDQFGLGVEAVDYEKQKHLVRGGSILNLKKKFKNYQIRYDIASVDKGVVTYIENAF